jgi:hypothetical protein
MPLIYNVIKRFVAPALPQASQEYDQKYFDKFNSILRLYFNQLDQLLGQLVSTSATVPVSIGGTNVDAFGRLLTISLTPAQPLEGQPRTCPTNPQCGWMSPPPVVLKL